MSMIGPMLGSVSVGSKMFTSEELLENKVVWEAWHESTVGVMFNKVGLRVLESKLQLALEDESESKAVGAKGARVEALEFRD